MSSAFDGGLAYASCIPNAGTSTVAFRTQSGDFLSATYNGVGDYTLAFLNQVDPAEACVSIALRGNRGFARIDNWTDAGFDVLITGAIGPADIDFDVIITQRPAN